MSEHTHQEHVLPPNGNHSTGVHTNGTTQRMPAPYETEPTLAGYCETSARLVDDVANGIMDAKQAGAANAAVSNGISTIKTQLSLLRQIDKMKDADPALQRVAADMMGGASGKRFHGVIDARQQQRQIEADKSRNTGGDKPDQG